MGAIAVVMIAILLITVFIRVLAKLFIEKYKNGVQTKEIDYRVFFFIVISFLSLGIGITVAIDNPGFMGLGIT